MDTNLLASHRCHRPSAPEVGVVFLDVARTGLQDLDPYCIRAGYSQLQEQILEARIALGNCLVAQAALE